MHVECESKSDTGNNRDDQDRPRITQTAPAQHGGKARYRRTTDSSHIGHCTQTAGSADVKVQKIFHGRNNITCGTDCKTRTVEILYTVETWLVAGI